MEPPKRPGSSATRVLATGVILAACAAGVIGWRSCREPAAPPKPPRPRSRPTTTTATTTSAPASRPVVGQAEKPQTELDRLLKQLDANLYRQCRADIEEWLALRAKQQIGGILPDARYVKYRPNVAIVQMTHGAVADMAAQFFSAYEVLGKLIYRDAALRTCEFLLDAQQPRGHWLQAYVTTRSGKIVPRSSRTVCHTGGGYQFRPFALLLYAHKLTKEPRYLAAAKRAADCMLAIQDPANGAWPDFWDFARSRDDGGAIGTGGVRVGGSYAEFATTDGVRMMIMAYHKTGNRKYLAHLPQTGQWLFDTQIGRRGVRGWCERYAADATPVKKPTIRPHVFARFTAPVLAWFYGMTGEQRYLDLLREACQWTASARTRRGWSHRYLPDGTPVFLHAGKLWRYDAAGAPAESAAAGHTRDAVLLTAPQTILAAIEQGGRTALLGRHAGPTVLGERAYLHARLAAARRATDAARIQQVRKRWMRSEGPDQPEEDHLGRRRSDRQAWYSMHAWPGPHRPPLGVSQWQYVYDVRLARGEISADAAATGGRGLVLMYFHESWDVMGDWTQRAVEVPSWLDVPIR